MAVSVHSGSTADLETFMPEVRRLRRKFGFRRVVVAGDRGMLADAAIETLRRFEGVDWISALKSASIRKLVRDRMLGPAGERNLFELAHPDFPGERLITCRNPRLAERRRRKREELLAATEALLEAIARRVRAGTLSGAGAIGVRVGQDANRCKAGKHFRLEIGEDAFRCERDRAKIAAEAALDGICVVRTSLEESAMDAEDCVRSYKALTRIDNALMKCLHRPNSGAPRSDPMLFGGSQPPALPARAAASAVQSRPRPHGSASACSRGRNSPPGAPRPNRSRPSYTRSGQACRAGPRTRRPSIPALSGRQAAAGRAPAPWARIGVS